MTKTADSYTHWFIFDGQHPVDGEFYTDYSKLLIAVGWHDTADYAVCAFDIGAPGRLGNWTHKGETQLVDVTKEVAQDWWDEVGAADTMEKVRGEEAPCFLAQYCGNELAIMQEEIHGAANAADRWHDERMAAE